MTSTDDPYPDYTRKIRMHSNNSTDKTIFISKRGLTNAGCAPFAERQKQTEHRNKDNFIKVISQRNSSGK